MVRLHIKHERRGSGKFSGVTIFCNILIFLLSSSVFAQAPVTYDYTTDALDFLPGCPACNFVGQRVSGSFVYDPETSLTPTPPNGFSVYLGGISDWFGAVESHSFSDDLGLAVVGDDIVGGTRDLLRFTPGLFLNGFEVDGFTLVDVRMLWLEGLPGDPAGNPDFLTGQSLPTELPGFPGILLLDFENSLYPGVVFTVNFQNLTVTRAPINVVMDIKPGNSPNSINPDSKQNIPVAVLTTDTFDATQIDPLTVVFGPNEAPESHGRSHIEDVDEDGDADLILHFRVQEAGIQCGDTEATLTGETFDGRQFTGSDAVRTVPCHEP